MTRSALDGCLALGFAPEVIWAVLGNLGSAEYQFIKTLESDKCPGEYLDVYDAVIEGQQVYVKLKVIQSGPEGPKLLVVLSFKRNEYYERVLR